MFLESRDEIVETRTWSSGAEIVARVNWSQIARVRRALGLGGEAFGRSQLGRARQPLRRAAPSCSPRANARILAVPEHQPAVTLRCSTVGRTPHLLRLRHD